MHNASQSLNNEEVEKDNAITMTITTVIMITIMIISIWIEMGATVMKINQQKHYVHLFLIAVNSCAQSVILSIPCKLLYAQWEL